MKNVHQYSATLGKNFQWIPKVNITIYNAYLYPKIIYLWLSMHHLVDEGELLILCTKCDINRLIFKWSRLPYGIRHLEFCKCVSDSWLATPKTSVYLIWVRLDDFQKFVHTQFSAVILDLPNLPPQLLRGVLKSQFEFLFWKLDFSPVSARHIGFFAPSIE